MTDTDLDRQHINSLTVHPTYGGPRMDLQLPACPCCASGRLEPVRALCDACWSKIVRLMQCWHGSAPKKEWT